MNVPVRTMVVLLATVLSSARAQDQVLPVQGLPRSDRNSQIAHAQLLEKAKRGGIDVYFEGDSITRRWGALDRPDLLANWKQNFFGWNAGNFGWGADGVRNILWRLENGELDGVNPKVIVLLAGTNDLGGRSPSEEDRVDAIVRGLEAIVAICRKKAPAATIVLMGILPRNDNMAHMATIGKVNERLAKLADGKQVRFLDINHRLADSEGKLREGMTDPDKLHLALKGYQVWADALKPIFTELLGPAGAEDHAPPPTGDPSKAPQAAAP